MITSIISEIRFETCGPINTHTFRHLLVTLHSCPFYSSNDYGFVLLFLAHCLPIIAHTNEGLYPVTVNPGSYLAVVLIRF